MIWTWPLQPGPAPIPIVGIREAIRDRGGELLRDELEDDRERARLLDRERVVEQRPGLLARLALDPELADRIGRLGRQADVAHDRDSGLDERLDDPGAPDAALDLDGLDAGIVDESAGVAERLLRCRIGQERHVADDEGTPRAAGDGRGVVEHVLHRHAELVLVAEHRPAERVADEQQRDAGLVEELGRRVVVGGQHRDPLAVGVHLADVADGQAANRVGSGGGRGTHRPISCRIGSVCAAASPSSSAPRHAVEEQVGDSALGKEREGLLPAVGGQDRHAVRVGPEARARLGDVVGDEQVDALPAELVGGAIERAGLGRESDEDRARPAGAGGPDGRRRAGQDVLGRLELDRQALRRELSFVGAARTGRKSATAAAMTRTSDESRMLENGVLISAVVSTRTISASPGSGGRDVADDERHARAAIQGGLRDRGAHLARSSGCR